MLWGKIAKCPARCQSVLLAANSCFFLVADTMLRSYLKDLAKESLDATLHTRLTTFQLTMEKNFQAESHRLEKKIDKMITIFLTVVGVFSTGFTVLRIYDFVRTLEPKS